MQESEKRRHRVATAGSRREDLVAAARAAFTEKGFAATSLREIARRTGMTHVGLLHHFDSKEALLTAMLDAWEQEEGRWYFEQLPLRDLDHLGEVCARLVSRHLEDPSWVRLLLSLAAEATHPDHPAHGYFQRRYAAARSFIAETLVRHQAPGAASRDVDPVQLAATLLAALDGLQVQAMLDPAVDAPAAVRRLVADLRLEAR